MECKLCEFGATDLDGKLERWIEQRTGGRVYGLSVETLGRRVIVHSKTGSYHVRQLALAAVLEGLESAKPHRHAEIELDIEVDKLDRARSRWFARPAGAAGE